MAQGHHLVGQQPDRPAIATFWSFRAGQGYQMRFGGAIEFSDPIGTFVAVFQDPFDAAFYQTPAKPFSRPGLTIERLGDLGVCPSRPVRSLIEFQQHLGVQPLMSRHPFSPDDLLQLFTFPAR